MVVLSRQLLADESKSGPSCTYPVPKIMLYYRDHQGPWLILVMVHPNPIGFPVFLTSWVRVVLGLSKWFPKKAGSKCVKARRNAKKEQQKARLGKHPGMVKAKQTVRLGSIPVQIFLAVAICHPGSMVNWLKYKACYT